MRLIRGSQDFFALSISKIRTENGYHSFVIIYFTYQQYLSIEYEVLVYFSAREDEFHINTFLFTFKFTVEFRHLSFIINIVVGDLQIKWNYASSLIFTEK